MRQFTIVTLTKNLGHNLFSFIFITCHIIRLFQFNFLNHSPVYALSILPVLPWVMLWALICPLFTNHSKKLIFFFLSDSNAIHFHCKKKKKIEDYKHVEHLRCLSLVNLLLQEKKLIVFCIFSPFFLFTRTHFLCLCMQFPWLFLLNIL